jgi:hypothetical protein
MSASASHSVQPIAYIRTTEAINVVTAPCTSAGGAMR